MVVSNLTERGIYNDFALWYQTFFGIDGIVVMEMTQANQTANMTGNETESNATLQASALLLAGGSTAIPAGMENIVAWIQQ